MVLCPYLPLRLTGQMRSHLLAVSCPLTNATTERRALIFIELSALGKYLPSQETEDSVLGLTQISYGTGAL